MTRIKSEQEEFWAGDFGKGYIERNRSDQLLASNLKFFSPRPSFCPIYSKLS